MVAVPYRKGFWPVCSVGSFKKNKKNKKKKNQHTFSLHPSYLWYEGFAHLQKLSFAQLGLRIRFTLLFCGCCFVKVVLVVCKPVTEII